MFKPEKYTPPKFDREPFISFPDVTTEKAGDGYIPENFYATTIYPEYFKINGEWKMLTGSRMDCSVVIKDGMPYAVEMRNIKKGDEVVVNRTDDGRDGIFVHADGFSARRTASIRRSRSGWDRAAKLRIPATTTASMIFCATTETTAR